MDAGRHPNIELLDYSEVVEVKGYVGNFDVQVRRKPRQRVRSRMPPGRARGTCRPGQTALRIPRPGRTPARARRDGQVLRPFGPLSENVMVVRRQKPPLYLHPRPRVIGLREENRSNGPQARCLVPIWLPTQT